jgi:hypothetical protein
MHVVVLRRDVYERRPWLARSLYKAFEDARAAAATRMSETAAPRYMLPWLYADIERTQRLMGRDFWSYGLAANENTLRTFLRYSHEQHLASKPLDPRRPVRARDLRDVRRLTGHWPGPRHLRPPRPARPTPSGQYRGELCENTIMNPLPRGEA